MSHALFASLLSPLFAQDKLDTVIPWVFVGIVVGVVFVIVVLVVVINYGKLWFQAYMSNARVSLCEPDRHELAAGRCPRDRAGQDHGHAGGHREPIRTTGSPRRRLEAHYLAGGNVPKRDQGDHRRPSGRHRSRFRPRRRHRPGRPRRARRRADQRLSESDRLPRPGHEPQDHAQRDRQERRRVEGPGPRHRADESRSN